MTANATLGHTIVNQVVLERLVDDLDELEMISWAESEYDRARLRELAGEAMLLAATLLEAA